VDYFPQRAADGTPDPDGNVGTGVDGMDSSVTDRLWDKEVQEFIAACKAVQLGDVVLSYTEADDGKFLGVAAVYRSARWGPMPIGYSWVKQPATGWLPEVFLGRATGFAGQRRLLIRRAVWRQGLWWERHDLSNALEAVGQVFFKAQAVRAGLDGEHLKLFPDDPARAQELTLQTLNDLAFLYSRS
jgi:hypothetical protein